MSLRTSELLLNKLLVEGSGVGGKVYRNLSVKASEGIAKRNVRSIAAIIVDVPKLAVLYPSRERPEFQTGKTSHAGTIG